jgi:hypothetical protein
MSNARQEIRMRLGEWWQVVVCEGCGMDLRVRTANGSERRRGLNSRRLPDATTRRVQRLEDPRIQPFKIERESGDSRIYRIHIGA